jgi:type II secretory pathway pseudopilin PulG
MKPEVRNMLGRVGGTGRNARRSRSAFTLLEALIAVAALGLLAVGVASIFDATGKTVQTGRTLSSFNAYASLIEQQLRADIAKMTPDGFLVIRNEMADRTGDGNITLPTNNQTVSVDAVPLYDGDERARMRRIDELMFFAKGEFVTARPALHKDYIARSDAARIYYGHGQKARQNLTAPPAPPTPPTDWYYLPELDGVIWNTNTTDPDARLGRSNPGAPFNPPNPNAYASDWILLRQVTLLAPPRTSEILPSGTVFGWAANDVILEDNPNQISLQPATSHVFRRLSGLFPNPTSTSMIRLNPRPTSDSGLVDIAASDLPLIRSIVTTASKFPNQAGNRFFDPTANTDPNEFVSNDGVDGVYTQFGTGSSDPDVIDRMRSWMMDAMPANSMDLTVANRRRIRCELSPRNYLGALATQWGGGPAGDAQAAYRAADQVMLSASNFLPRCTEFIVEFSFGKTWPSDPTSTQPPYNAAYAGQLVWHGMLRRVGTQDVARPYDNTFALHSTSLPYSRINGTVVNHPVLTRLIHGVDPNRLPGAGLPIESCFGYFDPTFDPDADDDGKLESANDSASPTLPWPWPKLIRVTLSLADPNDPSIERTFQFVFEVPGRGD